MSRLTQLWRKHPRAKRLPRTELMCDQFASSRSSVYMYYGKDAEKRAAMQNRARCKNHARWRFTYLKPRGQYNGYMHGGETVYVCSSHLYSHCMYGDMREHDATERFFHLYFLRQELNAWNEGERPDDPS